MAGTLHFKSKAGYQRWLAFGQMHGMFKKASGNQRIFIAGRLHKVKH